MHDGSLATLEEAIDHYAAGGKMLRDPRWSDPRAATGKPGAPGNHAGISD